MQRPWRDVTYWLASPGLLSLLSYRIQDYQPRDDHPQGALFPRSLIEKMPHGGTSTTEAPFSVITPACVCQVDTGWSYHRERSFSWGSASMRSSCGAFSQLVIKWGGSFVGGTTFGLVLLGSIREQAEQARGSKSVRNIPPWLLHQLLLPDLLEFQS